MIKLDGNDSIVDPQYTVFKDKTKNPPKNIIQEYRIRGVKNLYTKLYQTLIDEINQKDYHDASAEELWACFYITGNFKKFSDHPIGELCWQLDKKHPNKPYLLKMLKDEQKELIKEINEEYKNISK